MLARFSCRRVAHVMAPASAAIASLSGSASSGVARTQANTFWSSFRSNSSDANKDAEEGKKKPVEDDEQQHAEEAAAKKDTAAKAETAEKAPSKSAAAAANPAQAKLIKELEEKVAEKEKEIKELKNKALYALAEADTARRISREDVAKAKEFSITGFAKDMLEVNDSLERSMEAIAKLPKEELDQHPTFNNIMTGVRMTQSVMAHNLGRHGVEKQVAAIGEAFDPNKHEALFNAPESEQAKAGQIAAIVKPGFMLRERVLRATQVGVAEKKEE